MIHDSAPIGFFAFLSHPKSGHFLRQKLKLSASKITLLHRTFAFNTLIARVILDLLKDYRGEGQHFQSWENEGRGMMVPVSWLCKSFGASQVPW